MRSKRALGVLAGVTAAAGASAQPAGDVDDLLARTGRLG